MIIWFTGLSGAGKSTLCRAVEQKLRARDVPVEVLDGDEVRRNLSKDLGFSRSDRIENLRRIHYVAQLLARNGITVLVAAIAPYNEIRDEIRQTSALPFLEVYVDAPLAVCEQRDPKGLYRKARQGLISEFTGISDPFEVPTAPDVTCYTAVGGCSRKLRKGTVGGRTSFAKLFQARRKRRNQTDPPPQFAPGGRVETPVQFVRLPKLAEKSCSALRSQSAVPLRQRHRGRTAHILRSMVQPQGGEGRLPEILCNGQALVEPVHQARKRAFLNDARRRVADPSRRAA